MDKPKAPELTIMTGSRHLFTITFSQTGLDLIEMKITEAGRTTDLILVGEEVQQFKAFCKEHFNEY